jgi:hypothetical protein
MAYDYRANAWRILVLQNVNKIEPRARIRASVTKQLEANPELEASQLSVVYSTL